MGITIFFKKLFGLLKFADAFLSSLSGSLRNPLKDIVRNVQQKDVLNLVFV